MSWFSTWLHAEGSKIVAFWNLIKPGVKAAVAEAATLTEDLAINLVEAEAGKAIGGTFKLNNVATDLIAQAPKEYTIGFDLAKAIGQLAYMTYSQGQAGATPLVAGPNDSAELHAAIAAQNAATIAALPKPAA